MKSSIKLAEPWPSFCDAVSILSPPNRIRPSESVTRSLVVGGGGGYTGPYDVRTTPYMVAPLDRLADRQVQGIAFVAPAQSGKTEALVSGWMAYSVLYDPCDMMIVQSSQHEARDFSRRRIDRMIRLSPELKDQVFSGNDDNVYDKRFRNGAYISFGWPSISQLSGKPIRNIVLTDYDRFPCDVDGEGDAFGLARARTKSFMSRGKVVVESSPGHNVSNSEWVPYRHEAPPCAGALAIYNQSDRNRLYWACPHCDGEFLAEMENLTWDKTIENPVEASMTATMLCPNCGSFIGPEYRQAMSDGILSGRGGWRSEAEKFGSSSHSSGIAGYWMQGPAAAFQKWSTLVLNYLEAHADYELTGNQEKIKTTVNTDQGRPFVYITKKGASMDAEQLMLRKEAYSDQRSVPHMARFLTTAVDVQKRRFVVSVMAWGEHGERWVVDRFNLTRSDRIGENGEREIVNPFSYPEDWMVLDRLFSDSYGVQGMDGVSVFSQFVVCDSAGGSDSEGVNTATSNAYAYFRHAKKDGRGRRFALLKGASSLGAARIKRATEDKSRAGVDLFILNVVTLKDEVHACLLRDHPGMNYIHLPEWAGAWYYRELSAEERTPLRWAKRRKGDNNEEFDLQCYHLAAVEIANHGRPIDWGNPPVWASRPVGSAAVMSSSAGPSPGADASNDKYRRFRELGRKINEG